MHETRLILDAADRLFTHGEEAVLASVVRVEGSVYRRPGAKLLITAGGETFGSVSGGCLESDLVRKAWWRTEDGPALVVYDSTADEETAWHFGLGCNGIVHVLLERIARDRPGPLAFVRQCLRNNEAGVIATAIRADVATGVVPAERLMLDDHGRLASDLADDLVAVILPDAKACLDEDRSRTTVYQLAGGEVEVSLEIVRPPIRLVVFGGGFDVPPVVNAAAALGWSTSVVSRRQIGSCRPEQVLAASPAAACERLRPDARTAAVIMNHNYSRDREALAAMLDSEAGYIGVLGPRARTERMLAEIDRFTDDLSRIHAPTGLDIGAENPEEIAAAILAEVVAVFAGRRGGSLRDRPGPIHRPEPVSVAEPVR